MAAKHANTYLVPTQALAGAWLVELLLIAILSLNRTVAQTSYVFLNLKSTFNECFEMRTQI